MLSVAKLCYTEHNITCPFRQILLRTKQMNTCDPKSILRSVLITLTIHVTIRLYSPAITYMKRSEGTVLKKMASILTSLRMKT